MHGEHERLWLPGCSVRPVVTACPLLCCRAWCVCFVCVFDSLVAFFVCHGSHADRVAPLQVAKLRASEEKFLHEAGLRERLALQRQQITELEAAVMEKEAAVTDLRFEVETERETSARLRRRCAYWATLGWACCRIGAVGPCRGNVLGCLVTLHAQARCSVGQGWCLLVGTNSLLLTTCRSPPPSLDFQCPPPTHPRPHVMVLQTGGLTPQWC
jgi:hypothetical protein